MHFPAPGEFPPVAVTLHVGGLALPLARALVGTLAHTQLPPAFNLTVLRR